jgi:hypothetical protein
MQHILQQATALIDQEVTKPSLDSVQLSFQAIP